MASYLQDVPAEVELIDVDELSRTKVKVYHRDRMWRFQDKGQLKAALPHLPPGAFTIRQRGTRTVHAQFRR